MTYIDRAAQYQADVLDGTVAVCQWVRLACERNRRDLDRQESPDFPYVFDADKARKICQMAELLPHTKGEKAFVTGQDEEGRNNWNPIVLEPWQCWLLCTLFGWVHRETGLRRFRVGLWLIPRKNAKSTLGAIVALYMLTADGESGGENYSAATTRDQAKVVAEIAWEMTRRSPAFREYFGIKVGSETTKTLSVPATGSKFAPLSADAQSLDGLNVSFAAVDELHAHKNRGVWDVLDTATGARQQPLLLAITTAGVELGGICHEKMQYGERILSGTVQDETFFFVNYTIDTGDDWRLPEIHRKANPNYGVSVKPDDLLRKVHEAQHSSGAVNNFLTKHLNVWVRAESTWMNADSWHACKGTVSWEDLRSVPCWIGVDLGEVRDYSVVNLTWKKGEDEYIILPFIYVPEAALENSPVAQLPGWVRDGWIIKTPGSEADYARIEADLLLWVERLNVQEIDFDRRSARLMMQKIRQVLEPKLGRDRAEVFVVDVPQSVETMDPAMKTAERLVTGKRVTHDGNPAMAWMIQNIVIERNHKDEIYPRKAGGKDSHNKIDGPIAFFTALSRAMLKKVEPAFTMFFAGGGRR